jgi:hypothetical protein
LQIQRLPPASLFANPSPTSRAGALVPQTTAVVYFPHMTAKKPNKKRKVSLDSVLSTVKRGFADLEGKMDRGFAAVADDIADIKTKMATRDDIANLGGQLTSVERELKSIRRDLSQKRSRMSPASRKKSITPLSALPRLKSVSASTKRPPPDRAQHSRHALPNTR